MSELEMKQFRQADYDIDPVFLKRWSPRSFLEKEVPEEVLMSLFEAARWAPSANNSQPWHFIIAREAELLSKALLNLSEKHRMELADDIHGSFLQDLILLKRRVEENQYLDDIKKIKSNLKKADEQILDIIYLIRETCHELFPPLISERGIKKALQDLIGKFQLRSNIHVECNIAEFEGHLDKESELYLYRIVQELLTNAIKHSKATQLVIKLWENEKSIFFYYADNGIGLKVNEIMEHTHIGIMSIKIRVNSLNGDMNINTLANEGMNLTITIPNHKSRE